jgi:putative hemolysin
MNASRVATVVATCALLLTGAVGASATGSSPDSGVTPGALPGATYCTQTGGTVHKRYPVDGTNGSNPLPLSGFQYFCMYRKMGGTGRIHVLLSTLYTKEPTLAALAYYAKVPINPGCHGNPASCYCSQLGGTDLFGGINAAGGGWVNKHTVDQTLEACIFPDMSSIDSWGLTYHSAGIIRGVDLSKVLRYHGP